MPTGSKLTADQLACIERHCQHYVERFGVIHILGHAKGPHPTLAIADRIPRQLLSQSALAEREPKSEESGATPHAEWGHKSSPLPDSESQITRSLTKSGKPRRVFVTGEGGSGKTEFTRNLAYVLADGFLHAHDKQSALVPIHIHLKLLGPLTDLKATMMLEASFEEPLRTHLLDNKQIVFIFDGLDELNPEIKRATFDGLMHRLMHDDSCRGCPLVLAGRESALRDELALAFRPQDYYQLEPLSPREIDQYIQSHFKALGKPARGKELKLALRAAQGQVRQLIRQPFMLAMTCHLFETSKGPLPQDAYELIREALLKILGKREDQLGHILPVYETLGDLAARTYQSGFQFTTTDKNFPQTITPEQLNYLALHSGILARGGGPYERTYTFTNRVIAEFLAGDAIARHGAPGCKPNDPQAIEQSLTHFYSRHVWSAEQRNLLRWFMASLWRHNPALTNRIAQWLHKHLAARGERHRLVNPSRGD